MVRHLFSKYRKRNKLLDRNDPTLNDSFKFFWTTKLTLLGELYDS